MRRLGAGVWIWVVAAGSLLVQLVLGSSGRAPSWDEAIYLSQVARGAEALPFVASRARGITLLASPLAALGSPLWLIRTVLAVAAAVVLALVFRLWVPTIGWGAVAGALLFGLSWPALLYGSEVMPNLWTALFGVGTVGFLARWNASPSGERGPPSTGVAAMAAAMALMRPPDALVLALALTVGVVVLARAALPALLPLAIGLAAGTLPWLIEMSARFGGPIEALKSARDVAHLETGSVAGLGAHLALSDGPLLGPDAGSIPIVGALWWGGLLSLTAVAFVRPTAEGSVGIRLAAIGGLALGVEYLALISGLAPRFLLPALALLSVTAGAGIETLRTAPRLGRVGLGAIGLALAAWAVWQISVANDLEEQAVAERRVPQQVGRALKTTIEGAPCLIASTDDYPQVAFAAGCAGRSLADLGEASTRPLSAGDDRRTVVVTSRSASGAPPFPALEDPAPGWSAWIAAGDVPAGGGP